MKIMDKMRDKFFIKIWRRVKGLRKVLKPETGYLLQEWIAMIMPQQSGPVLRMQEMIRSLRDKENLDTFLESTLISLCAYLCSEYTISFLFRGVYLRIDFIWDCII